MTVVALIFFVFARDLAGLLARNQAVLDETTRYLRFNMFSEPFMALSAILGGALQGAGDTRGTLKVVGICMWLIRLPLAWFSRSSCSMAHQASGWQWSFRCAYRVY